MEIVRLLVVIVTVAPTAGFGLVAVSLGPHEAYTQFLQAISWL
jgi:hypothetical protein